MTGTGAWKSDWFLWSDKTKPSPITPKGVIGDGFVSAFGVSVFCVVLEFFIEVYLLI